MPVIARSSHAICHSFFTVRRVTSVAARRSTALVFTRTFSTQSRFSDVPRFPCKARPFSTAIASSGRCPCVSTIRFPCRSVISNRGLISPLIVFLQVQLFHIVQQCKGYHPTESGASADGQARDLSRA